MGIINNLKREFRKQLFRHRINKNISRYKYVHVMYNDKFNKSFVDFLNKYFNSDEHMVLCYRSSVDYVARPFPEGKNVYEFIKFDGLNLRAKNIEKIIFHSLFTKGCMEYLYENKDLLSKSYWVIWGGDFYNKAPDEKKDFVKKNFRGYISAIKGDETVVKEKFDSDALLFHAPYLTPVKTDYFPEEAAEKDYTVIQINNSCDESTLEMLDILSKFKDENIRITTILSYGKMQFKDEIIEKGKAIFGDKFSYLDKLISPKEFCKYISDTDILIMNQNRQQGVGNIVASLYCNGKVFVKSDITTVKYLSELGLKVYDTYSVPDLDYDSFRTLSDEEKIHNKEIAKYILSDDFYLKKWEDVFNGVPLYAD